MNASALVKLTPEELKTSRPSRPKRFRGALGKQIPLSIRVVFNNFPRKLFSCRFGPFRHPLASLLFLLTLCLPAPGAEYDYTVGLGQVTITAYAGPSGDVTIPDTIEGLPVTAIGDSTFYGITSLTSVAIPNSVTAIGNFAFSYCASLTRLTLPNSVTAIGYGAFQHCASLTSVIIPNSVTTIGNYAFFGCAKLTSITISNGVKTIGAAAFWSCSSLSSINIPSSVTAMEYAPFSACTQLGAITVDADNSAYSSLDGVLFNKSRTELLQFPGARAGTYVVPDRVTTIGTGAFLGCTNLNSVSIPNSVTVIQTEAFAFCVSLTGVYCAGFPPWASEDSFNGANTATVYYLPRTTGWGPTFGGRPTKLWNPHALTADATFGLRSGAFGFKITGTPGITVVIEASETLTTPAWTPVSTNTLTAGSSDFNDPAWATHPIRIYRLRSP